jgi:hypothetical protein
MPPKKVQQQPKKKAGRPRDKDEPKKSYNVYLQPKDKKAIVDKHGSLTKAIETTIPTTKKGKK